MRHIKASERLTEKKVEKKLHAEKKSASQDEDKPKEPKYGPMPTLPNQRLWTRGMMVGGALIVLMFTSGKGREVTIAKQAETVQHKGQHVHCSDDYTKELQQYAGCVPEQCGRVITDGLVSTKEAKDMLQLAKKGMALGGSDGGATILDLHSGALSKGTAFVNVYSLQPNLLTPQDYKLYKTVRTKIHHSVAHHFGVAADLLHLTHPTFFSRLTDIEAKSPNDEYWHPHVDKETYEAFHYTSLLYLNDFGEDFKGGRFVFVDQDHTNRTVEPKRGRVSMFTSGSENLHYVEKVSSGERYALTVSFTCNIEAAIKDPATPK
ncbi:Hypothetical predicted protein [Cloeon dipterum]|uniref:Fe2OG dioxygenase domain-containing protein n=1 Tax=Cloeon dipterum TaxID=197152 RepID=A0A8S1C847_9INSE|nr:Hypothetical predicted protein [Cloeon dipterum]